MINYENAKSKEVGPMLNKNSSKWTLRLGSVVLERVSF